MPSSAFCGGVSGSSSSDFTTQPCSTLPPRYPRRVRTLSTDESVLSVDASPPLTMLQKCPRALGGCQPTPHHAAELPQSTLEVTGPHAAVHRTVPRDHVPRCHFVEHLVGVPRRPALRVHLQQGNWHDVAGEEAERGRRAARRRRRGWAR